ncbi:hypothetical protein MG293_009887 [Ovis ammon polii]|uniref:Uncharacterized protein n=1 Tax=Ovis ammon polii TaxID=230172 RepID=A0AAD4U7P9_OVIAM|nr:hypothetical protein MG293_009887 [Ovis ammon polii]
MLAKETSGVGKWDARGSWESTAGKPGEDADNGNEDAKKTSQKGGESAREAERDVTEHPENKESAEDSEKAACRHPLTRSLGVESAARQREETQDPSVVEGVCGAKLSAGDRETTAGSALLGGKPEKFERRVLDKRRL